MESSKLVDYSTNMCQSCQGTMVFLDVVDTSRGPCTYFLVWVGKVNPTLLYSHAKTHLFCLFKNGDLEFNSYGSYGEMGDPYE